VTRRVGAALALLAVCGGAATRLHRSARGAVRETARSRASLPMSTLALWQDGAWRAWWHSESAPSRWVDSTPVLARAVIWRSAGVGLEWGDVLLAGSGEAWRTRLVVVRFDPARFRVRLDTAFAHDGSAAWRLERAPPDAAVAVNAGQFLQSMPWGWVVLDGHQFLSRGRGPLATAVVIDSGGKFHWIHGDGPVPPGVAVAFAFQSYPTLLRHGDVPADLQAAGGELDVAHRDARLALGSLRDGRIVVAMTRFDAFGPDLGSIPLGLTTPEMAAVMGALGARDAVMLDGGISAQLLVRSGAPDGEQRWAGLRDVPLAMVLTRR
jgi:Phosphodiester glycosidase